MSMQDLQTANNNEQERRQKRAEFLNQILPSQRQGWLCLAQSYQRRFKKQAFIEYPEKIEKINDIVEEWMLEDVEVYFCVHLLSEPVRQQEYALPGNLLWADLDECPPKALGKYGEPRPQIIVATSPIRSQVYWLLLDEAKPITYRDINHRIYLAYKDLGCDKCWNLTRVLRMPETFSHKRQVPFYIHTIVDVRQEHKLINILDMSRNLPRLPRYQYKDLAPDDMKYGRSLSQMTLTEKILYNAKVPQGERTRQVFKLVVLLKENLGFGDGLVIQTLMKHPVWIDKWPDPRDRERNIRNCIKTLRDRSANV